MNTKVKKIIKRNKFAAAAALTLLGCTAGLPAALAADDGQAPSIHVAYGDLNIQSDLGAKVLYARIRNAAKAVCEPLNGADLTRRSKYDGCVSHAITTSVTALNNARLTAMHNESVRFNGKS